MFLLSLVAVVIIFSLGALGYSTFAKNAIAHTPWEQPASMDEVVDAILADRTQKIEAGEIVDFGDENEINVLVLGLDARKGNQEPRCDGIHMFTLSLDDWSVHITSVPRGTYTYIPPGTYPKTEYYLANACAYAGLDYGVSQIEKVVGVKADYVATLGFSQVLGIMRSLNLPTTESLQWLRHRQSYAIGDPQRSHNQAVFMKDLIITQASKLRGEFGTAFQYIVYSMIDTDMDYKVARALMEGYLSADIDEREESITLSMRPHYVTQDYHLDFDNPDEQIDALISYLKPFLSEEDLSGRTLSDIQDELTSYIEDRLDANDDVNDLIEKQIWLQVEDEDLREELHFAIIDSYVRSIVDKDPNTALDAITQYIFEKQTLGEENYAALGRDLMTELMRVEV